MTAVSVRSGYAGYVAGVEADSKAMLMVRLVQYVGSNSDMDSAYDSGSDYGGLAALVVDSSPSSRSIVYTECIRCCWLPMTAGVDATRLNRYI